MLLYLARFDPKPIIFFNILTRLMYRLWLASYRGHAMFATMRFHAQNIQKRTFFEKSEVKYVRI